MASSISSYLLQEMCQVLVNKGQVSSSSSARAFLMWLKRGGMAYRTEIASYLIVLIEKKSSHFIAVYTIPIVYCGINV